MPETKRSARTKRGRAAAVERKAFVYEGLRSAAISFPLGGIGTGSIGLSGAGRLIDWEIFNRPNKGGTHGFSHFAVRAEHAGHTIDTRILNGPFVGNAMGNFDGDVYRSFGFGVDRGLLVGMPHFAQNDFDGRFPVAELRFSDEGFPGRVCLTAFNPFVPTDERASGLPAAFFEITFSNPLSTPVTYSAVGVLAHPEGGNTVVSQARGNGWRGVVAVTDDRMPDDPLYRELLIATNAAEVSHQSLLHRGLWYDALGVYWRDLVQPGRFADRTYDEPNDAGGMIRDRDHSLQAGHVLVPPGEMRTVRFLIGWYVPNFEKYWVSPVWHFTDTSPALGQWRNWYATQWAGAEAIAGEAFERWDELKQDTLCFRDAIYDSTLPAAMVEAAGANLSTLKSPTVLRLEDGTLYGWEGCHPSAGSCEGSCTHVWNYQQAVAFLFPSLSRGMRTADYRFNLDEDGRMSFRLGLPLGRRLRTEHACVDGQFGNVMVLYRDWKLSGDDDWLRALWPLVKKSIAYAWSPRNADRWDPDKTGVLTGRQHHTLDMELFGPNAWLSGYYIGALSAAAEMAAVLGEQETAIEYRQLARRGATWIQDNLFNGEYFIQKVDLSDEAVLDDYARADRSRRLVGATVKALYWSPEHKELKCQIGEGCLVDQLGSQWHANLYGLPAIFDADRSKIALKSIHRYNFAPHLRDVANPGRVFGYGDESGTVIVAWPPEARRPVVSVPYASETFHGMEYSAAGTMLQYGMVCEAIDLCTAVRARYDGSRRNPWSEMECGSNYARSLSSWGLLVAAAGFSFDARRGHIGFAPRICVDRRYSSIWSANSAWGRITIRPGEAVLEILYGNIEIESIGLPITDRSPIRVSINGTDLAAEFRDGVIVLDRVTLQRGDRLMVKAKTLRLRDAISLGSDKRSASAASGACR